LAPASILLHGAKHMTSSALRGLLAGLCVVVAAGCASSGRVKESERAVQSMEQVHTRVVKAKDDVAKIVTLLGQIEQGGDLRKPFKSYTAAVDQMREDGETAAKRADSMRERREEYLAKWQDEAETIQNPAVREGMEERRQRVRNEYDRLARLAEEVRTAYQPFLRDIEDVQKALSIDLTAAGVQAIKPAITAAKGDGTALIAKLDEAARALNEFLGKMSPKPTS
jgi:hypothetical protein